MWRVEALLKNSQKASAALESVTGLAFARYPTKLFDDLVAYGHEFAVKVLDNKQYHLFDPMVSDRSCQLRAIWLSCFWQFKKKADDLTDEDRFIFGLARFLTESAVHLYHAITGDCPLKTRMLSEKDDAFGIGNAKERRRFLGVIKAIFAERVLSDLERWWIDVTPSSQVFGEFVPSDCEEFYLEILRCFANPVEVSYSDVRVPVIHFFAGFPVVMSLAARFNVVLGAVFRQAFRDSSGHWGVRNTAVHYFRYHQQKRNFMPIEEADVRDEGPLIVFSGHSYLEGEKQIDPVRMVESLNAYSGQNGTFLDYVYGIISTHEFVPGDGASLKDTTRIAPQLAQVIRKYRQFADKANVRSLTTANLIDEAIRSKTLTSLELQPCAYEIVHIHSDRAHELGKRQINVLLES